VAGFSSQRLIIIGAVLAITCVFSALGWMLLGKPKWVERFSSNNKNQQKNEVISWGLLFLAFGFFNLLLIPDYRWDVNVYLFYRARPVIIWACLVCVQGALAVVSGKTPLIWKGLKEKWAIHRSLFILAGIIAAVFCGVWAWMGWSGMGIFPDQAFWNDPGVPLQIYQVYMVLAAALILFLFEQSLKRKNATFPRKVDWALCVLIFLTAALLWNLTPQKNTVFAPGPYPPTGAFYPHSDAEVYDLSAQNALVGAGYNTPVGCPDKGLYITFITWLNFLAGLNQGGVTLMQVTIFSILPVMIYLIGEQINSRSLGVVAAGLSIFKESNAISSASFISTSMSKMMMTELPTAIFIALFILVLIRWIKNNGRMIYLAGAMGGIIGLSTLVRLNMFIFVPFALLVFGQVFYRKWKKFFITTVVFFLVLAASILPWMVRIQVDCNASKPFSYILTPLDGVILTQRYRMPTPTAVLTPQASTPQAAATQAANPGALQLTPTPSGFKNDQMKNLDSPIKPAGMAFLDKIWAYSGSAGDKIRFISSHFFHNLLATILILPTGLVHDDVEHITNQANSFWSDNWNGQTGPGSGFFLVINLVLIALGCAAAWKKWKLVGIIPGLVFLVYCLALGLARTSGGRYIVPADWILYFYYGGGWIFLLGWTDRVFVESVEAENPIPGEVGMQQQVRMSGVVLAVFLGIGFILPGTEKVFPAQVYAPPDKKIVNADFQNGGYSPAEISQSNVLIYSGRAINPRYFFYKQDIIPGGAVYFPLRYQRFVFTLVGKNTPVVNVVLPSRLVPENIINGTVISVAGCNNDQGFMDAIMIMYDNRIYYRYPAAESLKCPIKPLVCDDNSRTCK